MTDVTFKKPQNFVKINFTNRGLSSVVKSVRSLSSETPNRTSVVEIAKILADIQATREVPVGFVSLPELVGLDYVGYIVDKERLDKKTGEWIRVDEYRILGSLSNSFKDSRVAYGNHYRYRIRSIVKVTQSLVKRSLGKYDIQESVQEYQQQVAAESYAANQNILNNIGNVQNIGLTPNLSTGQVATSMEISPGVVLDATPEQTQITETPTATAVATAQNFTNTANLAVASVAMMAGTMTPTQNIESANVNILSLMSQQKEVVSFYYESEPSVDWHYVEIVENQPPPPPQSIKIVPNTPRRYISVSWLTPAHAQRDIKKFRLYRRSRVGQRWFMLKEFPLGVNYYEDRRIRNFRDYIYAMTTIDAHGIESVLSTQIQAELNPNFRIEKVERSLKWISGSGAHPRRGFRNVFKKFYEPEVPLIAKDNFVIGPTRRFRRTDKRFVVRIKSLDIHEVKEFVVSLKNENIREGNEG